MDDSTHLDNSESTESIASGVESNGRLLEQLLEQVAGLRACVVDAGPESDCECPSTDCHPDQQQRIDDYEQRITDSQRQIEDYEQRVIDLEQQNKDLASQVASSNVRATMATSISGGSDALSWEDRKKLILQQMENDSFDADAFVSQLGDRNGDRSEESDSDQTADPIDPIGYVEQLNQELASVRDQIERRDGEIHELRCLLDQQSEAHENGVAVGAAAIAEMVDSDELVQQERERLKSLQQEWETKFRQMEIEASLERAKLSRERQELARKNSELEEQLEHMQREARHTTENGSSSRRWLAKLGLADADD